MNKKRFFALLFVLASIGLTLVIVCWTYSSQFEAIYLANEEEKLQLYVTLIASDLEEMPEETTDKQLIERTQTLFETIDEPTELYCRLYSVEEAGLTRFYMTGGYDSAADAYDYYKDNMATGLYSGSDGEYAAGLVKCAGTFERGDGRRGMVELLIGTDPLKNTNAGVWSTVFTIFAAVCLLAVVAAVLSFKFGTGGKAVTTEAAATQEGER